MTLSLHCNYWSSEHVHIFVSNLFLPHLVQCCFWQSQWCSTDHHKDPICWDCVICINNDKITVNLRVNRVFLETFAFHTERNSGNWQIVISSCLTQTNFLLQQTNNYRRKTLNQKTNEQNMSLHNFKQPSKTIIFMYKESVQCRL